MKTIEVKVRGVGVVEPKVRRGYLESVHNVDTLWTDFLENRIFPPRGCENARSVRKVTGFVDRHYLEFLCVYPVWGQAPFLWINFYREKGAWHQEG